MARRAALNGCVRVGAASIHAPAASGLDLVLRGLSMVYDDATVLGLTGPIFDGLYGYHRRALLLGQEPA